MAADNEKINGAPGVGGGSGNPPPADAASQSLVSPHKPDAGAPVMPDPSGAPAPAHKRHRLPAGPGRPPGSVGVPIQFQILRSIQHYHGRHKVRFLDAVLDVALSTAKEGDSDLLVEVLKLAALEIGQMKGGPGTNGVNVNVNPVYQEMSIRVSEHLHDPAVRDAACGLVERLAARGAFSGGNGDAH